MSSPRVVVLDYGSGNLRSAERALVRAGATVEVTADRTAALAADGLVVPGVGAFAACMAGLAAVGGDRMVDARLAGGRPVLGICVGMQVLFDRGEEHEQNSPGCGQWPGVVRRLQADVLPHMGWSTVESGEGSMLLSEVKPDDRLYFVHSYAVTEWELVTTFGPPPVLSWAVHGERFLAAVELGPLCATQFHPEKSGEAGAAVLRSWVGSL